MNTNSSRSARINTILRQYIRPVLFLIGVTFFVLLFVQSWNETKGFLENIKWVPFLAAALIGIFDHVLASLVFQQLLKKYGMMVPYHIVGKMYFYGQMSKYIPGRFWNVIYQRSFVEMPGATVSLFFVNVELLIAFMIRNAVIGITLVFVGIQMSLSLVVYIIGSCAFVFVGRTDWIVRGLHWLGNRFRKQVGTTHSLSYQPKYSLLFLYFVLVTITFLTSNFLMMYAAFGFEPAESYLYIAFLGIAWVIGALTIFVPAGVGIRELVFIGLANFSGVDLSIETLTAIAIVYRFWLILQEIGGVLLAFTIVQIEKR